MNRGIAACLVAVIAPNIIFINPSFSDTLSYAEQCKREMGEIPIFDCGKGDLLPITVNGNLQSEPVPQCDKPVQLAFPPAPEGGDGQCVPNSRLLLLDTGKRSANGEKIVTTTAICRKYKKDPPGPDAEHFYDDIAIIQHNRESGATCYFQSELGKRHNGSNVPSPSGKSSQGFWFENSVGGPGGITCTNCHAAGPFIWSPYVAQAKKLKPKRDWDPLGKFDSNFGKPFPGHATQFNPPGECSTCHAFGKGPTNSTACTTFPRSYAPGGGLRNMAMKHPESYSMPPDECQTSGTCENTGVEWQKLYGAALQAIEACCTATEPGSECHAITADGKKRPWHPKE